MKQSIKNIISTIIIFGSAFFISFIIICICSYFFMNEMYKETQTQFYKDYRIWLEKTKPESYKEYEFKADGKTYLYYKSKGIFIQEKK